MITLSLAPVAGKTTGGRHADVTSIVYASISKEVHEAYVFSIHGFMHLHRYLPYANCVILGIQKVGKPIRMLNAYRLLDFGLERLPKLFYHPMPASPVSQMMQHQGRHVFSKLFYWCHDF